MTDTVLRGASAAAAAGGVLRVPRWACARAMMLRRDWERVGDWDEGM